MRTEFILSLDHIGEGSCPSQDSMVKELQRIFNTLYGNHKPKVSINTRSLPHAETRTRPMGVVDPASLMFLDRDGAELLLNHLRRFINDYGHVTITDVHRKTGKKVHFTDNYWGWTELDEASIKKNDAGMYVLELPAPRHLTENEGNK